MTKTIYIQNQAVKLDPAQLIQSGGEGMVFQTGQTAVKLYHQPQSNHQQKLEFFFNTDLASKLPPEILAPRTLVTDKQGQLLGFQMPLLPPDAIPIKQLAKSAFCQKNGVTPTAVYSLFQHIHTTLTALHSLGIVIGDLNDQNIFITPPPKLLSPFFLDVDSYQLGRFPCPVAMDIFVDPNLYGIADLSQRPFFSPATDWYAFFVLLVRSLLFVHPYGGVHHQHKTIAARASAGLSILHPDVAYPASAPALDTLSPDLRHHLHRVFDLGERPPFPAQLLIDYANNAPRTTVQTVTPPPTLPASQATCLYVCPTGFIDSVHALPNGRFLAIIFEANQYKLVRFGLGGKLDERVLFNGRSGYQFAAFQNILAVNAPDSQHLLLLDISGAEPRKLAMSETALFRETAVFAATPHHLFRIAGTWIMRGCVQNGHFIEEATATAHRQQTWFCASPHGETIAGYHRVFAETRFFLWHNGQNHDLAMPALQAGESLQETAVTFTPTTVIFTLTINQRGKTKTAVYHATPQGKLSTPANQANPSTQAAIQLPQGTVNHTAQEIWYHAA